MCVVHNLLNNVTSLMVHRRHVMKTIKTLLYFGFELVLLMR